MLPQQEEETKARLPLTVKEVMTLEQMVLGKLNKSDVDRHVAGCFLFMIFARTRFSDKIAFQVIKIMGNSMNGDGIDMVETQMVFSPQFRTIWEFNSPSYPQKE